MTEKACNEIISQAFKVKGPEFRGYCKKPNKHIIHMGDSELLELLIEQ